MHINRSIIALMEIINVCIILSPKKIIYQRYKTSRKICILLRFLLIHYIIILNEAIGGIEMLYLGFILGIILYALACLAYIGYIVLFFMKKNQILERFVRAIFLLHLVVIAGLSWSVILMNQSFSVNLNIGVDYSYVLIISVPVIIIYEGLDILQRKKIEKSERILVNIVRYLLPVLTGILFFVCTIIFYFLCNDFQILSITI